MANGIVMFWLSKSPRPISHRRIGVIVPPVETICDRLQIAFSPRDSLSGFKCPTINKGPICERTKDCGSMSIPPSILSKR